MRESQTWEYGGRRDYTRCRGNTAIDPLQSRPAALMHGRCSSLRNALRAFIQLSSLRSRRPLRHVGQMLATR